MDICDRPVVTTMGISVEKTLVESNFGLVQKGSVLSYHQPITPSRSVITHHNAPPYPQLPLADSTLAPTECIHVNTEEEYLHLESLKVGMKNRGANKCLSVPLLILQVYPK